MLNNHLPECRCVQCDPIIPDDLVAIGSTGYVGKVIRVYQQDTLYTGETVYDVQYISSY